MNKSMLSNCLPNSTDDRLLWSSFKDGDHDALSSLYKKHFQHLYRYGVFAAKDHDLVLDCLQELFSCLWSKRDRISNVDCVKIYLFKCYHRLLINQIVRKKRRTIPLTSLSSFECMPPFEQTWIERELKSEQVVRLQEYIQSLSKGQREVIFLRFFNNLSYSEISEIMDMQVESVYNLVSKAIELLRKKFQTQIAVIRAA